MSYQGIVMAVVVTVSVGAAIYRYFANRNKESPYDLNYTDDNYEFKPRTATNPFPRKIKKKKEMDCSICYEAIDQKHRNHVLRCGHIFHLACITKWFNFNSERSCPNCRAYSGM